MFPQPSNMRRLCIAGLILVTAYSLSVPTHVLNFMLGGIMPGTNKVVSPLIVVLLVAALLLMTMLYGVVRLWRGRANAGQYAAVPPAAQGRDGASYLKIRQSRGRSRLLRTRLVITVYIRLCLVRMRCVQIIQAISLAVGHISIMVSGWMLCQLYAGNIILRKFLIVVQYQCLLAGRTVVRKSRAGWIAAEPYLWMFDNWLEGRVRQLLRNMNKFVRQYEFLEVILAALSEPAKALGSWLPARRLRVFSQTGRAQSSQHLMDK